MSDISENIRRLRRKKGLSQLQLAEQLHVTRQAVSGWETDKFYPDLETLITLSAVLDTDPNGLLYPASRKKRGPRPVSGKIVLAVLVVFSLLMTFGGGIWTLLLRPIVGGGTRESFLYPLYGGVILLAVLISVCTCLITEEIHSAACFRDQDSEDSPS